MLLAFFSVIFTEKKKKTKNNAFTGNLCFRQLALNKVVALYTSYIKDFNHEKVWIYSNGVQTKRTNVNTMFIK